MKDLPDDVEVRFVAHLLLEQKAKRVLDVYQVIGVRK
jgi:hypothetical protein